ncbi:MAG: DUF1801 domain-containing protein [Flavisolibacter sp.]
MSISTYLSKQDASRREILSAIHEIILTSDPSVEAAAGKMMGKDMILYNSPGTFKYGLASPKGYMSLHLLPIYCAPQLHEKYQKLLPRVSFQKGCINFKSAEDLPLDIVRQLIEDCSRIDLAAIRDNFNKNKPSKKPEKSKPHR